MAKQKEKKVASGKEANDVVLQYLKKQNRPYSAADVFNNLGGQVGKTVVVKALATLAEEATIHGKANGKQWVYVAKQDEMETPSKELMDEMNLKLSQLKDQNAVLQEEIKALQSELSTLNSSLTDDQIQAKLLTLNAENEKMEERLVTLRSGDAPAQLSDKEIKAADTKLEKMRKEWRSRKRLFSDMWGAVTESVPGSIEEFREAVGIETDESVGVNIADDPLKGLA
ncbi:Tat binding protein 1-interacting protein-domain-containing protein [Geranomyces variabilis]|nr:Tat binding protein 1-interacting protein-domain-containing protein [Geranomyces variabilis]